MKRSRRDLDAMQEVLKTREHKKFQRRHRPSQVFLKISLFCYRKQNIVTLIA